MAPQIIKSFPSSRGAALLLMRVRMIAIDEVRENSSPVTVTTSMPFDDESVPVVTPKPRCRTVSLDLGVKPSIYSSRPKRKEHSTTRPSIMMNSVFVESEEESDETDAADAVLLEVKPTFPYVNSTTFVGTTAETPTIKGVLRKKFSWKSYPELEEYLIHHRPKYMQYSSQLNYTAEQKRYNNNLTQGLLDLASEKGYVFEGFTFAAIRDRIRCYYKSYVQATKKKKRRKTMK